MRVLRLRRGIDGADRGFNVTLIGDGLASSTREGHGGRIELRSTDALCGLIATADGRPSDAVARVVDP